VKKTGWSPLLYAALAALYLLHNDLWLWNDPALVFGLPVGLVYHIGFCVAASVVLTLLVIYAWPDDLEVPDAEMRREGKR
jgi:Protein of unknown function (DUF3311)